MFHLLSLLRHRRTRVALTAAVASLSLAALPAGAHAALVQGQPQNVVGGFFDDHSIGGDNHLGWGYTGTGGTSQAEPLAITFGTTLTNTGPDQFRVCGYNAAGGWMGAYQVVAAACPATAAGAGAQDGWFRYVTANHSEPTATPQGSAFNRWHLMDLQRFALVPLPTSLGGPAGAYTAWDTTWGTCLSDGGPSMDCEQDATPAAPSPQHPGGRREDDAGAQPRPGRGAHRDSPEARGRSPTARTRSSRSRTRTASTAAGRASPARRSPSPAHRRTTRWSRRSAASRRTCYVAGGDARRLTGPGGRDPMAGAAASTCTPILTATGHCWATVPMGGANTPAASNVNATGFPTITATNTVPVAYGPQVVNPTPSSGAKQPAGDCSRPVHAPSVASRRRTRRATRRRRCASSSARA